MSKARVEVLADVGAILGEGAQWDPRDQALWWVDIKGREIFCWCEGRLEQWTTPVRVGSLLPRSSGGFISGTDDGVYAVDARAGTFQKLFDPESDRPTNRFNDGKVDRDGRLWLGTMDDEEKIASGALYRIGPQSACERVLDGFRVPNGPAFSPDGRILYLSDSSRRQTFAHDLRHDGSLGERRLLRQFEESEGYPDGITVDAEGCLWIAFWDGWCLRRLSPEGEILDTVRMPVARPTCPTFGGPKLDRLYVTSASIGLSEKDRSMQPNAGATFMCVTGAVGLAERPFAG